MTTTINNEHQKLNAQTSDFLSFNEQRQRYDKDSLFQGEARSLSLSPLSFNHPVPKRGSTIFTTWYVFQGIFFRSILQDSGEILEL